MAAYVPGPDRLENAFSDPRIPGPNARHWTPQRQPGSGNAARLWADREYPGHHHHFGSPRLGKRCLRMLFRHAALQRWVGRAIAAADCPITNRHFLRPQLIFAGITLLVRASLSP